MITSKERFPARREGARARSQARGYEKIIKMEKEVATGRRWGESDYRCGYLISTENSSQWPKEGEGKGEGERQK
jgi:hypothetical protein